MKVLTSEATASGTSWCGQCPASRGARCTLLASGCASLYRLNLVHTHTHTHTQAHTSTHVFVSVCIHSMLLCQITQGGAGLVGACKGRERVALAVAAGTHAVVRTRERLQRQAFLPPLSLSRTNRVRAIPPPRGSLRPCSTHVCPKRPSIKKCQKRQYGVVSKESKSGSERGLVQYKKRPTVRGIPERRGRALQAHGAAHFW